MFTGADLPPMTPDWKTIAMSAMQATRNTAGAAMRAILRPASGDAAGRGRCRVLLPAVVATGTTLRCGRRRDSGAGVVAGVPTDIASRRSSAADGSVASSPAAGRPLSGALARGREAPDDERWRRGALGALSGASSVIERTGVRCA